MNKIVEIYTDGSSLGNPGPGGWGTVITLNGKVIDELGGYEKNTTNNRMELQGVIEALKHINKNHKNMEVIIHTDSAYVLGGVTTWIHNWEKNGWRTANKKPVLNKDLWQELITLARSFDGKLTWQKVKGHSRVLHNERADEIATSCSSLQKKHIL
jgi:ribonuclease HI